MNKNSSIVRLRQPGDIDDPLTNILRSGARKLLAEAIEQEAEAFLAGNRHAVDQLGLLFALRAD